MNISSVPKLTFAKGLCHS